MSRVCRCGDDAMMPATVIASEDARFCTDRGVDLQEILDAIDDADDLSEARGGSTITQQTAKNLLLRGGRSTCAGARSAAGVLDRRHAAETSRARNLSQHRAIGAERPVLRPISIIQSNF